MRPLRIAPIKCWRESIAAVKQPSLLSGLVPIGALRDFGNVVRLFGFENPNKPFASLRFHEVEELFVPWGLGSFI